MSHRDPGAVRTPTEPVLVEKLSQLEARFPVARRHRAALRQLGSEYVFAAASPVRGFEDIWISLLRFGRAIESTFGFTREVPVIYSPHADLQIRTFTAIPRIRQSISNQFGRDADPDVSFLYCPDHRLEEKLDDWSSIKLTVLPLPDLKSDPDPNAEDLLKIIRTRLYARDLYYETTPVSGDKFFGRRLLVQSLLDDISHGRVSGLFGLRKSGKTSVLYKIRDDLSTFTDPQYLFVLRDLESLPSPPADPVPQLLPDLRQDFLEVLRQHNLRTLPLVELSEGFDIPAFRRALQNVLRKASEKGFSLVLALDEIEYLLPPTRSDLEGGKVQSIPQLLGAFRSLVQENRNFTFILAGLTSWILEYGRLFNRPNPLLSWAKPYFMSPFIRGEADELATVIGRRMGIDWGPEALEQLFDRTGGHPYLFRDLASAVAQRLPTNVESRYVLAGDVEILGKSWRRGVATKLQDMSDNLARFYPDETFLMELLLSNAPEFSELAEAAPQAIEHLLQLGLVEEKSPGSYRPASLANLLPRG